MASTDVNASPGLVNYNDHGIHDQNNYETQTVTFANVSGGAVVVGSAGLMGAGASQFSTPYDGCSGATLQNNGDSCTVNVQFNPSMIGPHSATLRLPDPSGATDVALGGNGITGDLTASPNPLSFNSQPYYYGGQQQGLNLDNPSNSASTQVSSITITGPDAGRFSLAYGQNCATQLINGGSSCSMGIGFDPGGAPGSFHAQVEIASDAASSPLIVPLNATALSGAHQTATPDPVAFGDVAVGQNASRMVTLANDGDYPMQSQQLIAVTGRPDVFFLTDDTCAGQTINPGQSCTVVAHFKPTASGAQDASLFIINGNQNPPVNQIGLNGNGVEPGGQPGPKSGGPTTSADTPPVVSSYGLTNSTFAVDGVPTPLLGIAATKTHNQGSTFTYTLSEASIVNVVISQRRSGRRKNKSCVTPKRSLRHARKCTRTATIGMLTRVSYQGANRIAFSGRIGTRALKAGRYQATLTARDAAKKTSKPQTISFTIVKH